MQRPVGARRSSCGSGHRSRRGHGTAEEAVSSRHSMARVLQRRLNTSVTREPMRNAPSEPNQGHRGIAGRAAPSVRPGIHHGAGGAGTSDIRRDRPWGTQPGRPEARARVACLRRPREDVPGRSAIQTGVQYLIGAAVSCPLPALRTWEG